MEKYPEHVLFTDDDEDDRELFIDVVQKVAPHIKVHGTANGRELISSLQKMPSLPDLVFLDLNMPEMGGLECLTQIRSNQTLNHIPVIIYSTSDFKAEIDASFEKGANLFVQKPSSLQDMRLILQNLLSRKISEFQSPDRKRFVVYSSKDVRAQRAQS